MRRSSLARVAALACIVSLAGCGAAGDSSGADNPGGAIIVTPTNEGGLHGAVLAEPYRVPPLTLTDTAGQPFHLAKDTEGPLTLVFFGYTNCDDVCSTVLSNITSAKARLTDEQAAGVDTWFVTTDPARDDPATLRAYLDRFDPSFEGLTAPLPEVVDLATSVHVPVEKGPKLPSGGYEVTHGTQVVGIAGSDRAPIYWNADVSQAELAEDIHTLLDD